MENYSFVFIVFIIVITIWLIIRELICWYYKINERLSEQRKTNLLLEQLLEINKGLKNDAGNPNEIDNKSINKNNDDPILGLK
jgi:hypothetical protein